MNRRRMLQSLGLAFIFPKLTSRDRVEADLKRKASRLYAKTLETLPRQRDREPTEVGTRVRLPRAIDSEEPEYNAHFAFIDVPVKIIWIERSGKERGTAIVRYQPPDETPD